MLTSFQMIQAKELEEPNNKCPFAHKNNQLSHLKNCIGYLLMLCQQPHTKPIRLQLLKQPMYQD